MNHVGIPARRVQLPDRVYYFDRAGRMLIVLAGRNLFSPLPPWSLPLEVGYRVRVWFKPRVLS